MVAKLQDYQNCQTIDFSSLRILVVGDVMIDRYLDGRVERISPEAPVPVMRLGREDNRLGGAANVALNLKALGATPLLAGLVGDDENGKVFRQLLTDNDLSDALIVSDPKRCTTVKTRLVAQGQQLMRVDREETSNAEEDAADQIIRRSEAALQGGKVDLLLFQDYNKGVLSPSIIRSLSELAQKHSVDIIVDPKARHFWNYEGCSLFKPNLREIQQQLDFGVRPVLEDLDKAAAVIFEKLACASVMITLSQHGIYVHDGTASEIYPTDAKVIADVSGAGDTVISVAACGLAAGMPLGEIARLANRAGAQVIAKSGVVAVDLAELIGE
ncbi:bifunctional heptose 7-phosphate kinase/heptose 1-phosphate adenyltransferase [Neolewinella agarilytica]|uniref:RfaE bifunctional protein, domain I n=1 Tax=Neolewinella agarilytica TaxID=478744 RepID=A0A1H9L1B4_9BACT|nr:PfkB family carbohydrate kinase [Neolewinella agarilytica]SER04955.1 rfaE bifunctional protein, domain I [Neolewinella agarilytica]